MIPRSLRNSLLAVALVTALLGQPNPQQPAAGQLYLDAFVEWRKLDPSLEREAATAGAKGSDRVVKAYAAVTKYTVARSAYARALADESAQFLLWIQNSATGGEIDLAPVRVEQALVSGATDRVTRNIATYAKETDRAFVQLRQALERERAALAELNQAIADRDKASSKARQLLGPSEEVRARALAQYQTFSTGYSSGAAEAEREEQSWAAYYQAFSDAISRPLPAPQPPPVVTAAAGPATEPAAGNGGAGNPAAGNVEGPAPRVIAGVRIMNPVNPDPVKPPANEAPAEVRDPPASPKTEPAPAPPAAPVAPVVAAASSVTSAVTLTRYVGEWTYPTTGGMFFGVQPDSIDLQVHEESGRLAGSLTGHFKAPAGISPDLQVTFAGEIRATRNQVLFAETSDGAKGTLELIPGNAYNLLEINFQTEMRPGKLRLVNFVVVKK